MIEPVYLPHHTTFSVTEDDGEPSTWPADEEQVVASDKTNYYLLNQK